LNVTRYNITNSSGSVVQSGSNNSVNSVSYSFTDLVNVVSLPSGTYDISVYALDSVGYTSTELSSFIIDRIDPVSSGAIETPASPTYSQGQNYEFNITWTDNVAVGTVTLEFDGANYSTSQSGSTYSKTISDLVAGTYNYKWYAVDTAGNTADSGSLSYTVSKAASSVNLLLDGTDGNINVELGTTANINATLIAGEASITLYEDGAQIATGDTNTNRNYNSLGTVNVTVIYSETENYTASSETHFITVVDTTSPTLQSLTESPADPATYSAQNYNFTVTALDSDVIDTVILEFGGFNYTTTKLGNVHNTEFNNLVAGNYNYRWYANDSSGNLQTLSGTYTVNRASTSLNLTLNGVDNNITVEAGSSVNFATQLTGGEASVNLYEDNALITSPKTYNALGTFNITAVYNQTQNYSSSSYTHFLTVVDTTAPSISIGNLEDYLPDTNITITATITDLIGVLSTELNITIPNGTITTYNLTNNGSSYFYTYSSSEVGDYNVTISATDSSGNTNVASKSFSISETAPQSTTQKGGSAQRTLRNQEVENTLTTSSDDEAQSAGSMPSVEDANFFQVGVSNNEPDSTLTNIEISMYGPEGITIIPGFEDLLNYGEQGSFTVILDKEFPDGIYEYDVTISGRLSSPRIALGGDEIYLENRKLTLVVNNGKISITQDVLASRTQDITPEQQEFVESVDEEISRNLISGAAVTDAQVRNISAALIFVIVMALLGAFAYLYKNSRSSLNVKEGVEITLKRPKEKLSTRLKSHVGKSRDGLKAGVHKSRHHVKSSAKDLHDSVHTIVKGVDSFIKNSYELPKKEHIKKDSTKLKSEFQEANEDLKLMFKEFGNLFRGGRK
jgi:hypothetical protein